METLKLEKVGKNYQIEILPWMFGWYCHGIPNFEYLKQKLSNYFVPEQLMLKTLSILEQMSKDGYKTGRLVADVKCLLISADVEKVGNNLHLIHPKYSYRKPNFEELVGCISEYIETFNSGDGRVTAGEYYNEYYEIIEIGEPRWVTTP